MYSKKVQVVLFISGENKSVKKRAVEWSSYLSADILGSCVQKAATCLKGSGYKEAHGFICISLVHHANDRVLQSIKIASLHDADVLKQVQTMIGGRVFHTSFQLPRLALSPYLWATITWQPFT